MKSLITEVYPSIYLNEIPLPNFPLTTVNSYIILSDKRNLIIDTGFNTEEGRNAILEGIQELNVNLRRTDLLLTHLHPDHVGMASFLQEKGVTVYIGKIDGHLINSTYSKKAKSQLEKLYEVLSHENDIMPTRANEYGNNSTEDVIFHFLQARELITVGEYSFEVMDIPGHTPGHIGLFERTHKLFFCGDHILEKISPSVMFWGYNQDILGFYINSLNKVNRLDIDYLFTAHFNIIRNHRDRISKLIFEYEERLAEIKNIMSEEEKSPLEVAVQVKWKVKMTWQGFSKTQKFSALGETLSFLEHLVHIGDIKRVNVGENLSYKRKMSN